MAGRNGITGLVVSSPPPLYPSPRPVHVPSALPRHLSHADTTQGAASVAAYAQSKHARTEAFCRSRQFRRFDTGSLVLAPRLQAT